MKKLYLLFIVCLKLIIPCVAQNVAITEDGSLPHPQAILDLKSTSKGLLIPRMSSADRYAMKAPKGLLVYDTTTSSFWYCKEVVDSVSLWSNITTDNGSWATSGNNVSGITYLGTTNNQPLRIIVNNKPSGEIHPARGNTFWGHEAGFTNSGYAPDSTGRGNTANGYRSLYSNGSGRKNTAFGNRTLFSNTTGGSNTASGAESLLMNTTGYNNTADGMGALYNNLTASANTASGSYSLHYNSTGSYNTGIGYFALAANVSGHYNTALGYNADNIGNTSNATAIGAGATVNASNKVRIGNSAVTVIEGQVPFTVPSDGRFKYEIKEDVKGLDFILQLRPVTYRFDVKRFETQFSKSVIENTPENNVMEAAYNEAGTIRRSGFIAQEVEKAALTSGYNFSGIIHPKTTQEHYSLSYESFVVPLVKAVQELNKNAAAQQQIISEQNKKIAALQQQLDEIKQLLHRSK